MSRIMAYGINASASDNGMPRIMAYGINAIASDAGIS